MSFGGTAKEVMSSVDVAEESDTSVEIKIKTMDSKTHTLRVNRCVPVPALKEQIASVTGVLPEHQHLICRCKVLKDDQLLSAYHVEDGHTLHLVGRSPPNSSVPSTSSEGTTSHQATSDSGSAQNHGPRDFVLETVDVDGDIDQTALHQFILSLLENTRRPNSRTNVATDELMQMGAEIAARATSRAELNRRQADNQPPSTGPIRPLNPPVIPDSLTTLNEYIDLLRDEFSREGFGANGREHSNNVEASGICRNCPASLAEILQSARQILVEQTQEFLFVGGQIEGSIPAVNGSQVQQKQLARQLDGHASITDPSGVASSSSDARGPQPSGPHQSGLELQISTAQGENSETNRARDVSSFPVDTVPPVPGLSPSTGQSSQGSLSHQQRPPTNDSGSGSRATNVTNVGNEQEQLLANMLHQIMPLISEGRQSDVSQTNPTSYAAQSERGNSTGSSSSRHPHDPSEPPSPKRRKSEE